MNKKNEKKEKEILKAAEDIYYNAVNEIKNLGVIVKIDKFGVKFVISNDSDNSVDFNLLAD